ncbi:hypothetical protein [Streptomyces sp. NPDC049040]|uniref:hypothetical protein n=1 Tax=Streptomyces sp. NPDC049040 TaxID=3365593 RepID=UPI0037212966
MIRHLTRGRSLLLLGICAAAAVSFCWYATQSVRPPCGVVVFSGRYTGLGELSTSHGSGKDGTGGQRPAGGSRQPTAVRGCDPAHARWHEWLG